MVTYFNKKDMISFGKFLLSDERKENIKEGIGNGSNVLLPTISLDDALKEVYHADIENWKQKQNK